VWRVSHRLYFHSLSSETVKIRCVWLVCGYLCVACSASVWQTVSKSDGGHDASSFLVNFSFHRTSLYRTCSHICNEICSLATEKDGRQCPDRQTEATLTQAIYRAQARETT